MTVVEANGARIPPDHLAANLAIFDFTLGPTEMSEIVNLKRPDGRVVNPAHAPQWDE